MLLIVGGRQDINPGRLAHAAAHRSAAHTCIYTDEPCNVLWNLQSPDLIINGQAFSPKGTSLFIRYDVFSSHDSAAKHGLFQAIRGWAIAHPSVGLLNRRNEDLDVNKPRALMLAREYGFDIPETRITRDFDSFADKNNYIVKPVAGGEYTRMLTESDALPQYPWIVQEKLSYPELRLFRIGAHFFAFEIASNLLDYRVDKNVQIKEVPAPVDLIGPMTKLTDHLGLDYAAADLKTHPVTGKLVFLEVNTMPMFSGYDDAAQGRLSDAMLLTLLKLGNNTKG
jgi:hypothetical protein